MTKYTKTSRRRTRGRARGRTQRRRRTQRGGRVGEIGEYLSGNGDRYTPLLVGGGRKRTQRGGGGFPLGNGNGFVIISGGRKRTQRGGGGLGETLAGNGNRFDGRLILAGGRKRTQRGGRVGDMGITNLDAPLPTA